MATTDSTAAIGRLEELRDRLEAIWDECAEAGPPVNRVGEMLGLPLEHIREEIAWLKRAVY